MTITLNFKTMNNSEISRQRFAEYVRQGWHSNPEVLEALKSGKTTPQDQAEAYFDVDETEGLSINDAAEVIERAMKSTEY